MDEEGALKFFPLPSISLLLSFPLWARWEFFIIVNNGCWALLGWWSVWWVGLVFICPFNSSLVPVVPWPYCVGTPAAVLRLPVLAPPPIPLPANGGWTCAVHESLWNLLRKHGNTCLNSFLKFSFNHAYKKGFCFWQVLVEKGWFWLVSLKPLSLVFRKFINSCRGRQGKTETHDKKPKHKTMFITNS